MNAHHNFRKVKDLMVGNYFIFHMSKGGEEHRECKVLFMAYEQNEDKSWVIKPIAVNEEGLKLLASTRQNLPEQLTLSADNEDVDLPDTATVINIFGPEIQEIIQNRTFQFRNRL